MKTTSQGKNIVDPTFPRRLIFFHFIEALKTETNSIQKEEKKKKSNLEEGMFVKVVLPFSW